MVFLKVKELEKLCLNTLDALHNDDGHYHDFLTAKGEKRTEPARMHPCTPRLNAIVAMSLSHYKPQMAVPVLEWLETQKTDIGSAGMMLWAYSNLSMWDECKPLAKRIKEAITPLGVKTGVYATSDSSWCLDGLMAYWEKTSENEEEIHALADVISFPRIFRLNGTQQHRVSFNNYIYPIHTLAKYLRVVNDDPVIRDRFLAILNRTLEKQGPRGEWWWTFKDYEVVQKYPLFTVHQVAMAPYALKRASLYLKRSFDKEIKKSFNCALEYGLLAREGFWRLYGYPWFYTTAQRFIEPLPDFKFLRGVWKVSYCYDMGFTLYAISIGALDKV
ncbi:MAG: hypothetical protein QW343_01895 [Candidatus Norongarragalinales archaeon]